MDDHGSSRVEGVYRDAGKLVIQDGAVFPDRCVICNEECDSEPIELTFKRVKSHYIEVAALQSVATAAVDLLKGAKYTGPIDATIPFCSWHRNARLRRLWIGGGLIALAAAYLFIRYLRGAHKFEELVFSLDSVIAIFGGVGGIGIAAEAAYNPTSVWFKSKKFYDRFVWVEGAGRAFLSTLPTLTSRFANSSPVAGDPAAARGNVDQRPGSKKRNVGRNTTRLHRDGDDDNLSAEELIRRARLAGVDDEEG
ncbi:MAG: hypothetical protein P4L84_05870 [Isosphaeraceae bacterium]|nr:hypothetical protein [Isosphaeraceae bacterium]